MTDTVRPLDPSRLRMVLQMALHWNRLDVPNKNGHGRRDCLNKAIFVAIREWLGVELEMRPRQRNVSRLLSIGKMRFIRPVTGPDIIQSPGYATPAHPAGQPGSSRGHECSPE